MQSLPTPALVIDLAVVERNIERLATYADSHEIALRPHTKTHKSVRLGSLQMAAGAVGLTVAKAGEAEVMGEAADDLLVAYPTIDAARTRRLAHLAKHKTVRVAVDSKGAAEALALSARSERVTLGVMVDLDVGFGRTGLQTASEALALAQYVDKTSGLRLDGLFFYPGHITMPLEQQVGPLRAVADKLNEALTLWDNHGLPARIISGGSTPTAYMSHVIEPLNEIRPGTYIFNDMNIVRGGFCTLEDCAARIIATVVSTSVPGQVVLDAGSKTLTSDRCGPAPDSGFGYIVEYPQAMIGKLTEEHGQVDVRKCSPAPKLGERVTIVPNHICPCVNLQDSIWARHADGELTPLRVDARGKLS